jgi:EmrB/QacA subfamily drug resistance transporter
MESDDNDHQNPLRWWILLTVIIGTFLGRLDQTIVSLALPKIISDFSITVTEASWIATAYILANAVFVPIWGKLGDTLGRKKIYILGFTVFIFGSVLAGMAWDLNSMIVFRIIQAIASSADYPTAMAILAVTFRQGRERAQALGLWSASFASAAVFGPLLGGTLIDNFGWRWVFFINLPVGLVGLFMALVFVEESVSEKKTVKFDWWGSITLAIALSALVLVLDRGLDWGWFSLESMTAYLTVIVFSVLFYYIDRDHPDPIVNFKFFRISAFNTTLINNFVIFMGMMGGLFLLPVFAQTFLGYNATETGYLFMPMAFCMMLAAPIGASLTGRVQPRYVIAVSTLVSAYGLYLFNGLDPRSGPMDIIVPVMVMAFSMGLGMPQRTNIIASIVPDNEMGIASSVLALARNIAGAFGIALFATILQDSTESHVLSIARNTVVHTASPLIHGQVTGLIILKADITAYHTVFTTAAVIVLIGAVLALTIKVDEKKAHGHVMADT